MVSKSLFKRKTLSLLFALTMLFNLLSIPTTQAAYTCQWFGYKDDGTNSSAIESCNQQFLSCEDVRLSTETQGICEGKCNAIGRMYWCETYDGCLSPANKDSIKPGSGEEKYVQCIESCRAKTYDTPPDCIGTLKTCCAETKNPTPTTTTTIPTKPYNSDAECQSKFSLAHYDANAQNGCRCNTPDAAMNSSTGKCEYTYEYLSRQCMNKYGPSHYSEAEGDCVCAPFSEWNESTQKCEADSQEVLEAKQELLYAFYYYMANMGIALGGEHEKAAMIAFNLSTDDYALDSGELRTLLIERRDMYLSMSKWKLAYPDTIRKAVGILKGKTTTLGKVEVKIEDTGTVVRMINDNWLYLLTGRVKIEDSSRKINVVTPSGIYRPQGTSFTVEHNLDTGESKVSVEAGSVNVLGSEKTTSPEIISAGSTKTTKENPEIVKQIDEAIKSIGSSSSTSSTSCFPDVAGHKYSNGICYVKNQGIVKGYDDGTYKPDAPLNRAEFAKIIIAANLTDQEIGNSYDCFKDVANEWFAKYVCIAHQRHIIGGYPDGTYKPDNKINLAEALKIILEASGAPTTEVPDGLWYQKYINAANQIGMLNGINSDPGHELTRGEMAEMIHTIETADTSTWETTTSTNSQSTSDNPSPAPAAPAVVEHPATNPTSTVSSELTEKFSSEAMGFELYYPSNWNASMPLTNQLYLQANDGIAKAVKIVVTKQSTSQFGGPNEYSKKIKDGYSQMDKYEVLMDEDIIVDGENLGNMTIMKYQFLNSYIGHWHISLHGETADSFYSWDYTAPVEEFETYYDIAEKIFQSWNTL